MRRTLTVVAGIVLAGGCGGLPTTHYYLLEPARVAPAAATAPAEESGIAIGVKAFRVDPPYDQDRIVYRVGEDAAEIGFYPYHRWAAPLSRMLPRLAAAELSGAGGVGSVEPAAPGRDYDAHLTGRLLVLEEVDTPEGQTVRARLELSLRLGDGTEVWSEMLSGEATTRTEEVGDIVREMRTVLADAFRNARGGLTRALGP